MVLDARALERARRRRILRTRLWARNRRPTEIRVGDQPLPIGPLASPLRIDILIRLDYLRWCREHLDLVERDREAFVDASMDRPYATWFRDVWCRDRKPRALDSPATFRHAFARRSIASVALLRGFLEQGFDSRRPVVVKCPQETLPSASGKRVATDYFPGDGCHRLALLLLHGQTELMPDQYLVDVFDRLTPLDHTTRLLPSLALSEGDYARFLSLGYAPRQFDRWETLADWVAVHSPPRSAELSDVYARDLAARGEAAAPGSSRLSVPELAAWSDTSVVGSHDA